jgi:hypothetical protein
MNGKFQNKTVSEIHVSHSNTSRNILRLQKTCFGYNGAFLWNNYPLIIMKNANTLNYFNRLIKERDDL